ncbi:GNAT family N-acetyltransferase [Pseudoduganella violaceinigra]|uniref:GNAT family N-acetyltransferase n=1 Tax=Pseudoduganella violaceinigra TaxID=246602 RepID=UPI0003FF951C|nr:GNAT family N-acetyltransferase [Pseudoduganella violaceinigra]
MHFLPLSIAHAAQYRALMLHSYEHEPAAFTATPEERAALPLSWWEQRISDPRQNSIVFGAIANGHLVGSVGLEFSIRPKTSHKAHLIGMYLLDEWRGKKIGSKLLGAALAYARRRPGVEIITLTVTEHNDAALALYHAAGFRSFGVEPMAIRVGDGYKAKVHMWLHLSSEYAAR